MRVAWLAVLLLGCSPSEERCLLGKLTDGEAARRVEGGAVLFGEAAECAPSLCVRDGTVAAGPPQSAALGYCSPQCQTQCPVGTRCAEVGSTRVCLRQGAW